MRNDTTNHVVLKINQLNQIPNLRVNIQPKEDIMKKAILLLCITAGLLLVPASQVLAFHDEGVARCAGCHTMHNSDNGVAIDADGANAYLLRDETASDVCLSCHQTGHGYVWGDPLLPPTEKGGGNFAWSNVANLNDGRNGNLPANFIPGYKGSHNIITQSHNSTADPVLTHSPGGNYPSSAMSCTSCHDPHGNTNFRLLYGAGHVQAGNFNFTNAAPDAEGISDTGTEAQSSHTAYRGGMSAWCANCHGDYHNAGANFVHKSGMAMGSDVAQIYNLYNGTGDQLGGVEATAYLPAVAFEDPDMTTTSTNGPVANSQVSCISCHRAHGTSSPNMGRWDFGVGVQSEDGRYAYETPLPAPYSDDHQRALCNKCHNKDRDDENSGL